MRSMTLAEPPPATAQSYKRIRWVITNDGPQGKPVMKVWRGKQSKPFSRFWYRSTESMIAALDKLKASEDAHEKMREEQAAAKIIGLAAMKAKVKVGSIFHYSWGYDQTNCEFWEVVAIMGSMVDVREIGSIQHSDGAMSMSAMVRPDPGAFLLETCIRCHCVVVDGGETWADEKGALVCPSPARGEEFGDRHVVSRRHPTLRKKLTQWGISFEFGSGNLVEDLDRKFYSSWYH